MSRKPAFTAYEFFAGGGMARIGLGAAWRIAFANDFDPAKARTYLDNAPDAAAHFHLGDVHAVVTADLRGQADLAWASSPCQDFSLAGARAGLAGGRSSAFFGFWSLMRDLNTQGRAPHLIVVENVLGLLTSHGGADFTALCRALSKEGYRFGALEIDAGLYLPQSRPRVLVVASKTGAGGLEGPSPFHTPAVRSAHARLPAELKAQWVWWRMAPPARRNTDLSALLEPDSEVAWRSAVETERLVSLMDPRHRARLDAAVAARFRTVGAVFRRTRSNEQRAEVRFDGLAGCLRTPGGGSSRQLLVIASSGALRSRWLTAREGARLMGLPDGYRLPKAQSAGLKVIGDGVAVPVVRALAAELLEPLILASRHGLQSLADAS